MSCNSLRIGFPGVSLTVFGSIVGLLSNMHYQTNHEKWDIDFRDEHQMYNGSAIRKTHRDNVFFLVYFNRTDKPDELYNGDFYPKRKIVGMQVVVKWECSNKNIAGKLIPLIGSAIDKRIDRDIFF